MGLEERQGADGLETASPARIATVRRALEAASEEGLPDMVELYHPDGQWVSDKSIVGGGTFNGRDEVMAYLSSLRATFVELNFEIHDIVEAGPRVLAITTAHARGDLSGASVQIPWWFLIDFEGNLIMRIESFFEEEDAYAAADFTRPG